MNFLAHIYLSANIDQIKIGNFISDGIRGNDYLEYPQEIQVGILLHRYIDSFTDTHPIVKQSKRRLQSKYGLYSGVIVDIFYDHFLAKNWEHYSNVPLKKYVAHFYTILQNNYAILPKHTQRLIPPMLADDWLYNYRTISGITKVLEGVNRRTKNRSKMNLAVHDLEDLYTEFETDFTLFFKELIAFSEKELPIVKDRIYNNEN